ncbi:MAG: glycogen/starch/alpha-glucan phosphorylase, partial [Peptococcaceae bacterium]|nr:glycogen/starch/alpha-glucan phosphorylase [Peptococcaceae bacterium]
VFKDFYDAMPYKFTNVTNGIAHRRWLHQSNPRLAEFLDNTIGHDYYKDAKNLKKLRSFENDEAVLSEPSVYSTQYSHRDRAGRTGHSGGVAV